MALDKRCIRATIGICGAIYLGVAIAIFILGAYAIDNNFLRMVGANSAVFSLMIMSGIFLILTAGIGMAAAYFKNECLAFIVRVIKLIIILQHGFLSMSVMLIFIALASSLLIIKNTMTEEINRDCSLKTGLAYQIDQIYSHGAELMCSNNCKCAADATLWPENQRSDIHTDVMGISLVIDCPTEYLTTYQKERVVPVIQALEREFDCAGICVSPKYYLFTGVEQGPPPGNCRDQLKYFVRKNVNVYAGFLLTIGILGMVSFGLSFTICYMKKKGFDPEKLLQFKKMKQ